MASEYASEDTPIPPDDSPGEDPRTRRSIWAAVALVVIAVLILLFMLRYCTSRVPNVVGLTRIVATKKLEASGYKVGTISYIAVGKRRPGTVAEQSPKGGTPAIKGASVDLVLALGGQGTEPPSNTGDEPLTGDVGNGVPSESAGSESGGSGSTDQSVTNPCKRAYPNASAWSNGGDIYIRLTSGGATHRVTSGSPWDTTPQVSPDGTYVVFLRAPSSGTRSNQVGFVCLTTLKPSILALPISTVGPAKDVWYGTPAFAPKKGATGLQSQWIVIPQMFGGQPTLGGRLLVCNVWLKSSWAAWNLGLRQADTITLSRSSSPGCVRVYAKPGPGARSSYLADFNAYSGWYTKR